MAKLPTVTSPLPRDLQQFVQRVREALDSGGPDAVVTARQLIAAGVVESTTGGGITPIGGTIETPRTPSGLTASGALASVIVSWNGPQYKGHAYTEIWAHTSDVIGDAVLVGMTAGNSFAHNLGATATRYYWVRNVNQNGVVSAFNATNGTQGATGQDPAYLLTLLTDEITSTQLASSLSTRIDLIDGAANVAGSVNARIATEATSTTNALALKADASTVTTLAATVGSNTSAISAETTARTTADTSLASDITTLQTTTGGHTTSIQTNATSINGLEGQYTVKIDNNGHLSGFGLASNTSSSGDVFSEFMVSADRFSIVDAAQPWWSVTKISNGYSSYSKMVHISQSDWNSYTYVSGDKLVLQSHPTTSSDNKEYAVLAKTTFAGAYFIEVSGGTSVSQPATFASSAGSARALLKKATTIRTPFVVTTSSSTINGVTVPAGVFMDTAMIADATITNAKIGSLTADKITASLLNTVDFYGNTIAGASIYLGGTVTYSQTNNVNTGIQSIASPKVAMTSTGAVFAVDAFTIDNPGGTDVVPFSITSDVVSIDSALIKDGTITNAKIGNTIQSTSYNSGSAGWKIDKTGSAEFNDATFRGTLDVGGSSGSRMTITSTKLRVYDGNTLRVKIGDLS